MGERGYRLSGGERQRLTIARLLLARPRVVILDEATAHLDSESEAAVQAALAEALAGRTAIVIAHRLSTVRAADQIAVVERGRIVERGTHDELLAAGGRYAELYRTQFADGRRRRAWQDDAVGCGPTAATGARDRSGGARRCDRLSRRCRAPAARLGSAPDRAPRTQVEHGVRARPRRRQVQQAELGQPRRRSDPSSTSSR